jgi:hypothetical protein
MLEEVGTAVAVGVGAAVVVVEFEAVVATATEAAEPVGAVPASPGISADRAKEIPEKPARATPNRRPNPCIPPWDSIQGMVVPDESTAGVPLAAVVVAAVTVVVERSWRPSRDSATGLSRRASCFRFDDEGISSPLSSGEDAGRRPSDRSRPMSLQPVRRGVGRPPDPGLQATTELAECCVYRPMGDGPRGIFVKIAKVRRRVRWAIRSGLSQIEKRQEVG